MPPDPNSMIVELARLMNCVQLDETVLQLCIKLLDEGANPQQLAKHSCNQKETNSILT